MLMIYKVLAIMINIRFYICIFAASSRGSGQRRGTTRERSRKDMGRLIKACIFDLSRTQSLKTPFYFFLGLVQAFFWVSPGVCLLTQKLKRTKCCV